MNYQDRHQIILRELANLYQQDTGNIAALVTGSVARGDAGPKSDIDIIIVTNGRSSFEEFRRWQHVIEVKRNTVDGFLNGIRENPMNAYQFLDAVPLFEKLPIAERLRKAARRAIFRFRTRRNSDSEHVARWLRSVHRKLGNWTSPQDDELLAFMASTVVWKIVEGLYLLNGLPVPPTTTALRQLRTLKVRPKSFSRLWGMALTGTPSERVSATSRLASVIASRLGRRPTALKKATTTGV